MIDIKRFIIFTIVAALVLLAGCNSKNELSNKPIESATEINEIAQPELQTQTDSVANEPTETETTEEETNITEIPVNTETEPDISDSDTETDNTPDTAAVIEEPTAPIDEEPTSSIVNVTPEEGYNYIIADTDEETVPAIASTTDNAASENSSESKSTNNTEKSWWYSPQKDHSRPLAAKDVDFAKFGAYYLAGDSNKIYLTFDEGYENGYTPKILDVLKENNVHAAFFVTKPFVTSQPQLVKRMYDEGHLVCNHSVTHPNLTTKTDAEIIQEIKGVEDAVIEVTGTATAKFFRPPAGVYSERVLSVIQSYGYKTIFWSFAHRDWEVDNQPPVETTIQRVMDNHHSGMIMLIHAVSQSNTDALDTIIKNLKDLGYEFESLENLN